jgi:hypothetical protein
MTCAVELFFSQLLHIHFTLHPSAVSGKEKLFSFEELANFASIGDARRHYTLTKIESLLRGSFDDWISYMHDSIGLSMSYIDCHKPLLSEVFQRRNVIVHNGGLANSIYLSKVPKTIRPGILEGQDLTPDSEYLHKRIDLFEQSCVLIGAEMWKQQDPTCKERAKMLNRLAFEHLVAKRFEIAQAFSTFVVKDKLAFEGERTVAQLNLWLSHKRIGDWTTVRKEAETADYSAKSLRLQLGLAALLDDTDKFVALLPRALQADEIKAYEVNTYPIMEEVRVDHRILRCLEEYPPKEVIEELAAQTATENASDT